MRDYDPPTRLTERILAFIGPGRSVLDVGAGRATYHGDLAAMSESLLLVDAYEPYLKRARPLAGSVGSLCGVAPGCLHGFSDSSFDVVIGIDFVEHLVMADALDTMKQMRRIASADVLLFVPEGNHPQTTDELHMGGDHWQTHRTTWSVKMLEGLGFNVERWPDFHEGNEGKDPGALWCTWRKHA